MVYSTYKNGDDWGMVCDILLTTGKPWLLPSFLGNQSHRPRGFSMEHVDWCRLGSPYRHVPGPESLCCASDRPLARNRSFWALAVQPPGKNWKFPRHSAIHGALEIWRLPAWTLLDFQRMGKELHLIEATLGCWSLPNCYPHYPAAGINPSPKKHENMKTDRPRWDSWDFRNSNLPPWHWPLIKSDQQIMVAAEGPNCCHPVPPNSLPEQRAATAPMTWMLDLSLSQLSRVRNVEH